jgi:hypothetical protein
MLGDDWLDKPQKNRSFATWPGAQKTREEKSRATSLRMTGECRWLVAGTAMPCPDGSDPGSKTEPRAPGARRQVEKDSGSSRPPAVGV